MLLIYLPEITARARYIFSLVFTDLYGIDLSLTCDREGFIRYQGAKMAYGSGPVEDTLFFQPAGLLFEKGIRPLSPEILFYEGQPALFPIRNLQSALPFDPFAAAFYLVSRYEEYLPFREDRHGRFPAEESLAYKNGFLGIPIVNLWAQKVITLIKQRYPSLVVKERRFSFQPTIDIDSAYAYLHKGFLRNAGGYFRSLYKLKMNEILERTRVLTHLEADPFNTYARITDIHASCGLRPDYFILLGDYGRRDKNLSPRNESFRELIRDLDRTGLVGIHPSYGSFTAPAKQRKEIQYLSDILGRQVTTSRQHFLRLNLPFTYRSLTELQITHDYTMGFASLPGFRAGICDPFNFFDLAADTELSLRIHPFTLMDGVLKDYMGLSPEEAVRTVCRLIDRVKEVNGTFISIWHNESFCEKNRWKGWTRVYESMVDHALQKSETTPS